MNEDKQLVEVARLREAEAELVKMEHRAIAAEQAHDSANHLLVEAETEIAALVKAMSETVRVLELLGSFIPADIRALLAAHDAGKDGDA